MGHKKKQAADDHRSYKKDQYAECRGQLNLMRKDREENFNNETQDHKRHGGYVRSIPSQNDKTDQHERFDDVGTATGGCAEGKKEKEESGDCRRERCG